MSSSPPPSAPPGDPTDDELESLRHQLVRLFASLGKPASHVLAATSFLIGIQGRHGGKATLKQIQGVVCKWIERGWNAYDKWQVVEMPKELPEARVAKEDA
jgi:hypothetical protein